MTAGKLSLRVAAGLALLAAAALLAIFRPWRSSARGYVPALPRASPDILLITIDTLRADALGFAGNATVETPTLDRLASQGVAFTNAHAHNVVTLPSHANILTGLYPYEHGIRDNSGFRLDSRIATLATYLKRKGYATGAFVGAFPLDARFGLNRDFDVYDDRYPKGRTSLDFEVSERPASEVLAAAGKWYEGNGGRRRFLWIHLYDCHAPYRPPPPFDERYRQNPYLGEVAAMDHALAPFLQPFLAGRAPPTLIVMTGDHGEALGDHGEQTHGLFAYEATLRVPLLVWFPKAVAPAVSPRSVRHVDIAPTILEAAGVEKPAGLPGRSLLNLGKDGPEDVSYFEAYSAAYNRGWAPLRGAVSGGSKYVALPVPELYDLKADPEETRNLVSERSDEVRRLARALPPESQIGASSRSKPSSEEAARLKSLGYLSGSNPLRKEYTSEDDPKNLIGVDRDLHRCVDLYQRGDLAGATALARRVVRERPTMSYGYENLAFLLRQGLEPSEALRFYREAVDRGIANEQLKTHYALALCEAGRPAEAVALLEPLAQSQDPDTWNALGIAFSDSGREAGAVRAFERARELDPGNVETRQNMGIVRLRRGDWAGARELFHEALAMEERLPRAWNGLGVSLARLSQERDAIQAWQRAVELDPKLYDALYNLGLTAGKNGMRKEAEQALERFVATAPAPLYRADIEQARRLLKILREKPG